jgi:uroporphyrinogen decarboxylase
MFVFLHSCGSIHDLIPDLIDAGVDILNPVQISARNMEPERLKKEFGDQVAFWGWRCGYSKSVSRREPGGGLQACEEEYSGFRKERRLCF